VRSATDTLPRAAWEPKLRWWLTSATEPAYESDVVGRRVFLVATVGAKQW
jgi:hypothetical protein